MKLSTIAAIAAGVVGVIAATAYAFNEKTTAETEAPATETTETPTEVEPEVEVTAEA